MFNNIVGIFRWFLFISRLVYFLLTNILPRSTTMMGSMTMFTILIALNSLSIILKMLLLSVTLVMITPTTSKWSLTTISATIIMIRRLSSRLSFFLCKTLGLNIGIGKRFLLPKSILSFFKFS